MDIVKATRQQLLRKQLQPLMVHRVLDEPLAIRLMGQMTEIPKVSMCSIPMMGNLKEPHSTEDLLGVEDTFEDLGLSRLNNHHDTS